ncbi:MAG: hydrogenase 3 maturation endopeptidase HyCI [Candidatus Bathyarchaeia archaeon]
MELRSELAKWLEGAKRIAVLGIGNPIRRDDAIGVEVVKALEGKVPGRVLLLNCETIPESFAWKVAEFRPTHILLVDAADFLGDPGEARLFSADETVGTSISTHSLPLKVLSKYLEMETGAKVAVLAIQPKDLGLGEGLSDELRASLDRLIEILRDALFGPSPMQFE